MKACVILLRCAWDSSPAFVEAACIVHPGHAGAVSVIKLWHTVLVWGVHSLVSGFSGDLGMYPSWIKGTTVQGKGTVFLAKFQGI
jgi:hypothetical protein